MKPILLTMQAFGSYGQKTTIDFRKPTQNLFLITGDTGAGKTTIFDAIVFALYGQASSDENKKEGMELQSQFTGWGTTPYVELEFSEHEAGEEVLYTVRRTPRHLRPKRGGGAKPERESVSLILPDGTEYAQNREEINRKLVELVGLTKEQFMKVAMIAQGEFMALLRADSNKKKEIFRRLFNTELYEKIVTELDLRRKEKLTRMGQIRTACQTEAAHIAVPENYDRAQELARVRSRILESDRLNAADMDLLLEELGLACTELDTRLEQAEQNRKQAGEIRDRSRDREAEAENLLAAYSRLEKAQQELETFRQEEAQIQLAEKTRRGILAAYDVKGVYDRLSDGEKALETTQNQLAEQKQKLPELETAAGTAAEQELILAAEKEAQLKTYAEVSQRVQKALEILKKLEQTEKDLKTRKESCDLAGKQQKKADKALGDFEELEQTKKARGEALSGAEAELTRWQAAVREAEDLREDWDHVRQLDLDVEKQQDKAEKARNRYGKAREAFAQKQEEYLCKQNMFLDAQAGFLAREKLRENCPCPVCGSLTHPSPCVLSLEHQDLTREILEALAGEARELQQKQTEASAQAGSALEVLEEKKKTRQAALEKLRNRLNQSIPEAETIRDAQALGQLLSHRQQELAEQEDGLRGRVEELAEIQTFLKGAAEQRRQLRQACETAAEQSARARLDLEGTEAALRTLTEQRDYETRRDAEAAMKAADAAKVQAEKTYNAAHRQAVSAAAARDQAGTLIGQFEAELPRLQETVQLRKKAYESTLENSGLNEVQWQQITGTTEKNQAELLQKKIRDHSTGMAAAQAARDTAAGTIAQREKPDLEKLREEKKQAEENLSQAQKQEETLKICRNANKGAWNALAPQMEARSRLTREYTRIDSLYTRLAGKVTGGRMDMETFVQRYYLQQVLYAANVRFQDMSAGQFELRLIDEAQAGDGKNRGLDLMVYSAITGQEREVRTLSGGESFMAALALALGMADQIQAHSAAINLDMMFIDEGFGSLDAHSRDQAVKVLKQMAGGSRLIGIISHVTELKNAIEDQLLIRKDETGSHPQWVLS